MPRRAEPPKLAALQAWFQGEIVRPHEGGRAPARKPRDVVLPSRTLAPAERVAIYSRMYFSRLVECLAAEYRAVRSLLGAAAFERLCRAYLAKHPSRHWSLNVLGRRFPEFIGKTRLSVKRRTLVRDVARVEGAQSEVFDEADAPCLDSGGFLARVGAARGAARLRLAPVPAFRLLRLDWPANEVVTAIRQEKKLPRLSRKASFVAVYRKDDVVWRMNLDAPRHACLEALAGGKPFGAAIRAAAAVFRGPSSELEGAVFAWFREWVAEGFFRGEEKLASPRSRRGR